MSITLLTSKWTATIQSATALFHDFSGTDSDKTMRINQPANGEVPVTAANGEVPVAAALGEVPAAALGQIPTGLAATHEEVPANTFDEVAHEEVSQVLASEEDSQLPTIETQVDPLLSRGDNVLKIIDDLNSQVTELHGIESDKTQGNFSLLASIKINKSLLWAGNDLLQFVLSIQSYSAMSGLLNSGLNGSASNLPETTARALATSFSAQSGSTATVLNHSGVQSLQGIHGNFNMSNVHGTFASRNSAMTGGPSGSVQQAGNVSNGRFSINNIPTVLSQLSLASSHGHSGATNIGGSGVIANLENAGRIANSMTNIVSGSNIGRGLSADGGSNMHAPQMVSMLGNSYSGAGVPLLQNQFQAGNSHLASMALLNEYNARDNATFDINDFPQLGGRPPSAGGSQGQLGFIRKPNIGFSQQNQEFSIQNEDFPALPGFKGAMIFSFEVNTSMTLSG
nr:probable NOT transcription complex subunit VIP2 isoform X1 [Ipomoea batatas]